LCCADADADVLMVPKNIPVSRTPTIAISSSFIIKSCFPVSYFCNPAACYEQLLVKFASHITLTHRQAIQIEYKLNPKGQ
jgi:hypothetical protein